MADLKKQRTIAVLGSAIPPIMGGLEVYTWQLAYQWAKRGHRVFLIGYQHHLGKTMAPVEERAGVTIYRLPSRGGWGKISFAWRAFQKIKEVQRQTKIDICHANTAVPAGLAAALARIFLKIPYGVTSHGYELINRANIWWIRPAVRLALSRAGFVIGVSRELADLSIKYGAKPERTVVLANAVDTDLFRPLPDKAKARQKWGVKADEVVVLSLRRLEPKTGVQYLIKMAPRIIREAGVPVRFLIVGTGSLETALKEQVRRDGIEAKVAFTGVIDNDLVPELLALADISTLPSLAEATSIAALEAMACGLAVVASNVGGLPEIIQDGSTGRLVVWPVLSSHYEDYGLPEEAVSAFARAVIELVNDPAQRMALGRAARIAVEGRNSWRAYLNVLEGLYGKDEFTGGRTRRLGSPRKRVSRERVDPRFRGDDKKARG